MSLSNNYPIDVVITWVDGGSVSHQQKVGQYIQDKKKYNSIGFRTRYDQVEEIKFTVDSILKFAKFVRNIYIITDEQTPLFIVNKPNEYTNVKIIDHKVIFNNDLSVLPTFNSRSIETKLYKIPKLSEHFIYFNDDMFLIKETKITDFFIDGFPVLRGKWLSFSEEIWYKKLFSKKKKKRKASHRKGQELGAKIMGFNKFYKFDHVPYALRKSTFSNFFKANKEIEKENINYRFRDYRQFIPQSLANHIEIKNKTCVLKKEYQLTYIRDYTKSFFLLKFKLKNTNKNKNKLFLNLQGLDQCPKERLSFILNWLEKITK